MAPNIGINQSIINLHHGVPEEVSNFLFRFLFPLSCDCDVIGSAVAAVAGDADSEN